ncbi:MAG: hypothetical protein M1833_000099 [Piccolia ochrophora]|nr:MAG: hypothetical protein M1833_000099 [Piccolia ochrophora]
MPASRDISPSRRAWVTLLTKASYLPGVVILNYTLRKHRSIYPLVVLVTESLPQECVEALQAEDRCDGKLDVHHIEPLIPRQEVRTVAERFDDTWTKLRVFDLVEYDKVVFLDADIMVMGEMDSLFDIELPGTDWLGATHACCCNLDNDPWAPADWKPPNCPFSTQTHPSALRPSPASEPGAPSTYHLMNSGVFGFHPSPQLRDQIRNYFHTTPLLPQFTFPDQDFLNEFFRDRWINVGWQWNATKTKMYWHRNIWRDEEVRALHYIVDKPWQKRVGPNGVAGYKGRDGITHRWWWDMYDMWELDQKARGENVNLGTVRDLVAEP